MPEYHVKQRIEIEAIVTVETREELDAWIERTMSFANESDMNIVSVTYHNPQIWEVGVPFNMEFTKEYLDEHPCPEDEHFFVEEILRHGSIPETDDPSPDEYTNFRLRMEYERMVYEGIIQKPPPF